MQSQAISESWTGRVCNAGTTRWVGVKCTAGEVISINLTSHVWGGVLPSELYLLPSLVSFECSNCDMSGKATIELVSIFPPFIDQAHLQ